MKLRFCLRTIGSSGNSVLGMYPSLHQSDGLMVSASPEPVAMVIELAEPHLLGLQGLATYLCVTCACLDPYGRQKVPSAL